MEKVDFDLMLKITIIFGGVRNKGNGSNSLIIAFCVYK